MKILHTSDWHLGHQLYGYDRMEEQREMLRQIEDIVEKQQPDALLVCGDVFHTAQPSAMVQKMFAEAMVRMHEACPAMVLVVTAGNHDSGTRHEIFRTPWLALKVYVVGNINKVEIEEHIIEIKDKGFIVSIPYANERNMDRAFFQEVLDAVAERNVDNLPVVMTAHTTVRGCDPTGHEQANELTVGGIDAFSLEELGEGYDYLALGHIHHAQFINGSNHRARYSGTPMAVSFDETFSHSVSLVEIDAHGASPRVETIDIDNPRPLVSLPANGVAEWEECQKLLAGFPDDIPAYVRLNVTVDDFLPADANAVTAELAKGKQCRFCYINAVRKTKRAENAKVLTVQEFQAEEPVSIVRRYAEDLGCSFDQELEKIFGEALALVAEDNRNKEEQA